MTFGEVAVAEAEGAILAHSVQAEGREGGRYRMRKGKRLTSNDLTDLARAGHSHVVAAVLGPDDLDEDEAARRLADALVPDPAHARLRLTEAATGRVNVFADVAGVAQIDVAKINAFNLVDPMITVATVPALERVAAGDMVATIKIISYAVPQAAVIEAKRGGAAITVAPPVYQSATLIETTLAADARLSDKGRRAMAGRLARFGAGLTPRVIVPHEAGAIAEAIKGAEGDVVMILTASATSDPRDVAPEAVRQAGGQVARFGMPVDPGNLLFLGDVAGRPVLGLPGCARSPVMNGADWVLERLICGVPVTDDDIAAMGVGGLLKETPGRIQPREA